MKIAVTDANIFIDLIKLQWLGYLFNIELEIYSTREVIDELNDSQLERVTAFIQSKQLAVYYFSSDEWEQIVEMNAPASLTPEDKSVVFLAIQLQAEVLSGDNPLRKFCEKQKLEVKGILWLFDRFVELKMVTPNIAIEQMNYLLSFNNRLPALDCQSRLKRWEEML